jgi:hypothetical protein
MQEFILKMPLSCIKREASIVQHQEHIMHHIRAMWAALGDPESQKVWKHLGIIKHFVRGYWYEATHPKIGPGLLEEFRLPLRRLYSYRIKSDYDAEDVNQNNLLQLLEKVERLVSILEEKGGK